MWYIFNSSFILQGLIGEMDKIEINHRFSECDDMTFSIQLSQENYDMLKIGRLINQSGSKRAFIIQTLEIKEDEKSIWCTALGIESLLNQRIVNKPINQTATVPNFIHSLVDKNLINPTDTKRKISGLSLLNHLIKNMPSIEHTYFGESVYSIVSELSKSHDVGYKIDFLPKEKKMQFYSFLGVDRTVNQTMNTPVAWRSNWGDTRDEVLLLSNSNYKNVVYTISGDEKPIEEVIGNGTGFDRFEMFSNASDIKANMEDDGGKILTTSQIRNLLKNRGNLELYRHFATTDFSFVLNDDINQVFGVDFTVGDLVSIVNERFGIIKHTRITTVRETIIGEKSQYEIIFDE